MENNNIKNMDVNITEEVQEKKEDLKIIKLKPSQLEVLKSYKTHKKDSYYDLFERLVNNKDELQKVVDKQFKKSDITRYNESIKSYINKITILSEDIERAAQDFVEVGLEDYYKELDKVAAEIVETVELKDEVNKLNELLKDYQKQIETHKEEIDKYKADIIDKDNEIAAGVEYAKELLNSNTQLNKEKVEQSAEHTKVVMAKDNIIEARNNTIDEKNKLIEEKTTDIIRLNNEISRLGVELSTSKNNVKVIEAEKDQIQKQVEQYKDQVENLKDQNTSLNNNIENLNATKDKLMATNMEQNNEIKVLLEEKEKLNKDINNKNNEISKLNSEKEKLVETHKTEIEVINKKHLSDIKALEGKHKTDINKMKQNHEKELNSMKTTNEKISKDLSELQSAVESDYVDKSTYNGLNSKCSHLLNILKKEGLLEKYNINVTSK